MYKKIILASNSPRRRELLSLIGVEFEIKADHTPEKISPYLKPEEVVCELAEFKGNNVLNVLEKSDGIIIS